MDRYGLNAVIDLYAQSKVRDLMAARRDSGIMAVIHKATEGVGWVDPAYGARRDMAAKAGLLWGAYHFGTRQYPGSVQAAAFLSTAQPQDDTLMALDLELNERAPGNTMTLGQAEDFVQTVYASTGRLPLLYTHHSWADGHKLGGRRGTTLGGYIEPNSILAACDLWLADYRPTPSIPSAWNGRGWRLWQFAGADETGRGGPFQDHTLKVAGIGRCDRNLFAGSPQDLVAYWSRPITYRSQA